jgi:preprotein translocase subunit SecA
LTRIGGDAVVRALTEAFAGGSWRFRLGATAVLEDVRVDSAVQAVLELLPHESDEAVGRRMRQALLGQFAFAAIEPTRQWLLERGFSDFEDRGLRNDLLRTCAVMGQSFPERDEWQEAHQAEECERLAMVEKSKENPMAALLYAMEQLTGKKSEDVMKEIEEKESARRRKRIPDPAADARPRIAFPPSGLATGRVGRNDPCPCGSGKKYKKCCLRK